MNKVDPVPFTLPEYMCISTVPPPRKGRDRIVLILVSMYDGVLKYAVVIRSKRP